MSGKCFGGCLWLAAKLVQHERTSVTTCVVFLASWDAIFNYGFPAMFHQGLAPSLGEIEELKAVAGEYCDMSTFATFCKEVTRHIQHTPRALSPLRQMAFIVETICV